MKRKDFYIEYYDKTNQVFADKMIWGKKEREEAWRKGQQNTSKFERKFIIITQYITLLLCWIPLCFNHNSWVVVPIGILLFLLQSFITDFSIIKIEWLYSIYRKNNIYCSVLHEIFTGDFNYFIKELKRATKKSVTGYVFKSGGKFYGKYYAICRNKNNKIVLTFKSRNVTITVNERITVIKNIKLTKEQLLTKIATVINEND